MIHGICSLIYCFKVKLEWC